MELSPADRMYLRYAEGWLALGSWLEANNELDRITPRLRAHPAVLRVRFRVCDTAGDWALSYEVARALAEWDGATHIDVFRFARSAAKLGKLKEAYNSIERAIDLAPDGSVKNNVRLMALDD